MTDGWEESADAWVRSVDRGDPSREIVLDDPMLRMAGSVDRTRVLDVGCGEGRFVRMLEKRGASVVGLDPIQKLLTVARERGGGVFLKGSGETLPFATGSFDLVVSYLTLIDIPDFRSAASEMTRVLRPGGRLLIANLNSFMTTVPEPWLRDASGEKLHVMVDNYCEERPEWVEWGGIKVINWHRPFSAYAGALLACGLRLEQFEEPLPSEESIAQRPDYASQLRVPYFHVMLWSKP
ncbi:MAG TPA: class I SAM-dependent methyltransferase [Fimbriimonadaceae bacterium]|nr:class I SAM-dependent methyltransferase [Fimbriimonadaceae bacterium]